MTKQEFDDASRAAAGEKAGAKAQGEKAQGFARVSFRVELEARGSEMRLTFDEGPAEAGDEEDTAQLLAAAALSIVAKQMHETMDATFTRGWLAEAYESALQEIDRLVKEKRAAKERAAKERAAKERAE